MAAPVNGLAKRRFAATGKDVSILGLGTVKIGRNQGVKYPGGDGFRLPTDAQLADLLHFCKDAGITLIDTAPAYGISEERLGKALASNRRDFFIVTKTGEEFSDGKSEYLFSAEHTRMSVERSLRRLRTDFLDCVLVHTPKDDLPVIDDTPVLETLQRLKEAGKLLSYGVSVSSIVGGKRAVALSDAVMVAFNKNYTAEREVIAAAHANGKAVLVKKALASGHVEALGSVGENIGFVLATPGVTSLVFGSISLANIRSNILAAEGFGPD